MSEESVKADIKLASPEWHMRFQVHVPNAKMPLEELLPLAQNLSNAIVDATVGEVEKRGARISCCKGCAACCRQLVPVSEAEARHLSALVESMPEPRRANVKLRFKKAADRLAEAGLLEKLRHPERWYREGYREFGLEYFRQGIPCPFLEDEACSIYPERPVTCREFLVVTPAKFCDDPGRQPIRSVKLPISVGPALAKLGGPANRRSENRWVPLVLALEWTETNPEPPPDRTGPDLLRDFIQHLTGADAVPAGTMMGSI